MLRERRLAVSVGNLGMQRGHPLLWLVSAISGTALLFGQWWHWHNQGLPVWVPAGLVFGLLTILLLTWPIQPLRAIGLGTWYGVGFSLVWALGQPERLTRPTWVFLALGVAWLYCLSVGLLQLKRANNLKSGAVAAWLGALGAAVLLAFFTGDQGSTGTFRYWFADRFGFDIDLVTTYVVGIRKFIHVAFYGIFAAIMASYLLALGQSVRRSLNVAAAWCLVHAIFDEVNQSQFEGRTGTWVDVVIDGVGIALALLCVYLLVVRRKRLNPSLSPAVD